MRNGLSDDLSVMMSKWPEIWQAAYRMLEQSPAVAPSQLQAWIQPLEMVSTENTQSGLKIQLVAPNDFSAQWVRDRHKREIESAFTQVTGVTCEVVFSAKDEKNTMGTEFLSVRASTPVLNTACRSLPVAEPGEAAERPERQERPQERSQERSMDARYIFDTFIVGASNQFAHASAIAVAEHPGKQYNPLFIYAPPGLGKTHLLHAIGNHLVRNKPGARVAYLSAEKFVNEMIDSVQHKRMPLFRAKYRDSYDMILIDDIQFIAGKTASEEEFFHTFNALHGSMRQIVVTCDRPPKEIEKLEERIRTRFEWGLVVDISPPEIETRIAILKAKAERDDIYLPDDVATFLATHIKSNVRELEGILIKLQAQASLTGAEISLEMAKHELKTVAPEEGSHYTAESIQAAVAKHFGIKVADLKSATRARSVALPRQMGMYLIRKYTGLGFKEIGLLFGGKDHSTVLHACKKIEGELETDDALRNDVESIQNLL